MLPFTYARSRVSSRSFSAGLVLGAVLLGATAFLPYAPLSAQEKVAEMVPASAQDQEFELSIRSIMQGVELVGQSPSQLRWTDDSNWLYFQWKPGGHPWYADTDLYRIPAVGGEPERVDDATADSLDILFSPGDLSSDRRWRVSVDEGDIYLVDRSSLEVRRLTRTTDNENSVEFSGDDRRIFFRQGTNLFALTLSDGMLEQLTDIRTGNEPGEDPEATGSKRFLEEQQTELFETVRVDTLRSAEQEAAQERRDARQLQPTYLGMGWQAAQLDPNPAGDKVIVRAFHPAQSAQSTPMPEWVTESGYTENRNVRSKVGDVQSDQRLGLLDVESGALTWVDLWPDSGTMAERAEGQPELAGMGFSGWNEAGTHAVVAAVSFDFKNWRLYTLDAGSGELTLLDDHHDKAWVGGPAFAFTAPQAGWIPGQDRIWYVSEETGWAHLYSIRPDGSGKRQLTSGEWEVRSVEIPEGADHFLLHTSETSPFDTQPWVMDFDGADRRLLYPADGEYLVVPSPDGNRAAVVWSRANRPGELFVADYTAGSELDQVTVSPTAEWLTFPWVEPEIVRFTAEDGTEVPARIYRPADMGAEPNGAAVVFVHGAGYLQNVSNGWSGYFREYMFHHFLAANGYTVLDIDYRGSAGYGRDWRTAIYRWMGGADLSDQVDGARYLVESEGIDADRIGIYGGSYGGFITLMALFTAGDTFKSGAALRSVTDWAHYNHWYTSRILNQPQDDEEAYRRSSPIYFAENFGPDQHLVMLHGMVDDNVHFSDVVRLSQRLIELGKENWELAVYPVEPHGFQEPASWTDEYRRIFELFERTISQPGCTENEGLCAVGASGEM